MSFRRWMGKQNVVQAGSRVSCSHEQEGSPAFCDTMDESGGHYATGNEPEGLMLNVLTNKEDRGRRTWALPSSQMCKRPVHSCEPEALCGTGPRQDSFVLRNWNQRTPWYTLWCISTLPPPAPPHPLHLWTWSVSDSWSKWERVGFVGGLASWEFQGMSALNSWRCIY